jgi:phospholipase/carboxylesterase
MQPISTTLHHIVLPPEIPSDGPAPAIILLHGRGANEEDLVGLPDIFDGRLLVLSVRAPFPFAYDGGFTWYDLGALGVPEPASFRESCDRLGQFVEDARNGYRFDPGRLILLGFSMGAAMALSFAASHPGRVSGVVAHSGYLPEKTHLEYAMDRLERCRMLVTHGIDDPLIPLFMARRTNELLSGSNAQVTYREYAGGHEITREMLDDAKAFITGLVERKD